MANIHHQIFEVLVGRSKNSKERYLSSGISKYFIDEIPVMAAHQKHAGVKYTRLGQKLGQKSEVKNIFLLI